MRYGLTIPYMDTPLAEHADKLREVADAGYTDFWSAEAGGADAFTPLALASQWVPSAQLGTAIVPAYTRGPGLLAMSVATMADAAPGRFTFGVGSSSNVIVERWNGIPFEQPLQRVRDTVRFLRKALAGEKVDEAFETFTVKGFRLERAPAQPPKILIAALRSKMLTLAGEEGDGAIINWLSAEDVKTVVPYVGTGKDVVARIFVCPSEDADTVRTIARRMVAAYLNVPVYAAFHDWLGRGEALAPMWEKWKAGDRAGALEAIPDQVVDDLIIHGPAEHCREVIRAYMDNGVTVPALAPIPLGMSYHEAALALAPR
ncbi:MAG TPA: LLM class F420-dependent oxidoreductase [Mycobacteriales bacterium]|jgi:probable F420-dependent oxidoreductase|nr:LLM class F420-dependent oxidoreductase [Mycobacteriales bacterium]